jgi:hypothetical protein
VSGPARPRAVPPPPRVSTDAFERLKALPDHRVVDRLLRGRAWIWLIGLLLGGIVAVQVSLLKLNAGISRAVEATGTLQRQNSALESEIARLDSSARIRAAAVREGMVDPSAGDTKYLTIRPGRDAALGARRMQPPSATAQAVMANHGHAPGTTVTPVSPIVAGGAAAGAPGVTATSTTGTASTGATGATATGATASTTAAPAATPTPVATPAATATPVPTATANQPVG